MLEDKLGKIRIKIVFLDETGNYEAGIDAGGLYKDFINEFTKLLFHPDRGYFIELPNSKELFLNPSAKFWVGEENLKIYKIIGFVIGRCFYERFTLNMKLSRTFLRKVKSLPNFLKELKYFDEKLYHSLMALKKYKNIEELDLNFTITEEGTNKEIELIPNGREKIVD